MSEFDLSRARRVCDACFRGDAVAMKQYADAYLAGGHTAVQPLGAAFRSLLPGRARRVFWEKAARQLEAHLSGIPLSAGAALPEWIAGAGGQQAWRGWARRQANRCQKRATTWITKTRTAMAAPTRAQWYAAILGAIRNSDGRGHFSRLPLSLVGAKPTDPQWPSVEHLDGPASLSLGLEHRIFNDMKSILLPDEFRLAVGHLARVLSTPLTRLSDDWRPKRDFGTAEPPEEPPLPGRRD